MAEIRPFRAWRYNEEVIQDINLKFSPLFDVVSPEQLEQLYKIPNNSIHLSVPKSHEEALEKLREWKENNVIRQDPLPGIYIYYQKFSLYGEEQTYTRKGFVTMIRVAPEASGDDIVLHEDTITHSVEDRTSLLEKTKLNVAPTHGLYDDPEKQLEALMDEYMEHPLYSYIDYQGVINQLAIVQDRRDIQRFLDVMGDKKVYLADGHHRLASSRELLRMQQDQIGPDSMVNFHLMYLTNLRSDDLRILPIHRILHLPKEPWNEGALLEPFREYFNITNITLSRQPIYEELAGKKRAFGLVWGSSYFLLELKPEIDLLKEIELNLPEPVKTLDYTILHYFIFDRIFGMKYNEQHGRAEIEYIKDYSSVIKRAARNRKKIGFIMPNLSMEKMMEVCNSGALMPQKSTYFYPKVVSGLVFSSIDDHENQSPFDLSFGLAPKENAPG